MTADYLRNKGVQVEPEAGKEYRVIGMHVPGAKYTVEKIEGEIVLFKGYNPKLRSDLKFYEVEATCYI